MFEAVMQWVREEPAAEDVELFATAAGRGMYERAGFMQTGFAAMRARLGSAE